MGFYETAHLIQAIHFVPSADGVTSKNVKKINNNWYYIKNNIEFEISSYNNSSDLSGIIHTLDDNKIDNYDSSDIINEERCSLNGLKLDWYIYVNGFTTLYDSSYTSLRKLTNDLYLNIDRETIQKYRKINNNKIILEKMENLTNQIHRLTIEHDKLNNSLQE